MADNTDHTTQSGDKDMNFIQRVGGKAQDCTTGHHDFQFEGMDVGSNNDTALMMKCVFCGLKQTVEAPLNVNSIIERKNVDVSAMQPGETPARPVQQAMPQQMPQAAIPPSNNGDDIIKKLFGR